MDETKQPHVVIVGAGFGGLTAARALKKTPAFVTVIDRYNHHLFQPLLYQVATAGLAASEIAAPIRNILRDQRNTEVLMGEVTGIDKIKKEVLLGDHQIGYDYLILATGARHSYFAHPEWEKNAPGLKAATDAMEIRKRILLAFEAAELESDPQTQDALLTFIVVGGGPTGVEVAGALAELAQRVLASDFRRINPRSARIILIEAGPRILSSFPEDLSRKALLALSLLTVAVKTNSRVENITEQGVFVGREFLPARTVIWAAGVVASPVGEWLGAATDGAGRVVVEPDMGLPNHPEIFVIGDCAHTENDGKLLPGLAPVAIQQGKYVASVINSAIKGRHVTHPFRYFDKGNLATVGRSFAIAQIGRLRLSGVIAWIAWLVVHIYYLIGFRNRVIVMIQWAWAYFTYSRGARLIISPASSTKGDPE